MLVVIHNCIAFNQELSDCLSPSNSSAALKAHCTFRGALANSPRFVPLPKDFSYLSIVFFLNNVMCSAALAYISSSSWRKSLGKREVYSFDLVDDSGESVALLHSLPVFRLGAFVVLESVVDFLAESNQGDYVAEAEAEAHLLLDGC